MTEQILNWTSSTQYDTGTVIGIDLDDQGNCLETHVGGSRLYYHVGKINDSYTSIDWGPSTYYANGKTTSISLAKEGYFVEVHASSGYLYSRVAKANFDNKTIEWKSGTAYQKYDSGRDCSVAVDGQDNYLEIHIGSYGIYYRIGKVDYASKTVDWGGDSTRIDGSRYSQCSVALDAQGNCVTTHVGDGRLYYRVGKADFSGKKVEWGERIQYDSGIYTDIALDDHGNCIATHSSGSKIFYRVGKLDEVSKTIEWLGRNELTGGSYTRVAINNNGNCLHHHCYPGSPNRLYYNLAQLALKSEWIRQFGSSAYDVGNDITVDAQGNIYATGTTLGQLGSESLGEADIWVAKYDSEGTQQWLKQIGSGSWDAAKAIAKDTNGGIYIGGHTSGNLVGDTQETKAQGGSDAFVIKLDTNGSPVWKQLLGSSGHEVSNAVVTDSQGNIYATGYTTGQLVEIPEKTAISMAWLAKLDPQGNKLWIKQLGDWGWTSANDVAVTPDGDIYITGVSNSNLGNKSDAWLAKYDPEGNRLWVTHLCKSGESASHGVAVDSQGNVYMAGYVKDEPAETISGWADAWIAKYDTRGNQQWFKQLGGVSAVDDAVYGIAIDGQDKIYVTGYTESDLGGSNAGGNDAWVAILDTQGNVSSIKQLGTPANDYALAIAVSHDNDVYLTGKTNGNLEIENLGDYDVWLARVIL